MGIDWKEVEKLLRPVPSYEELIKRLHEVLSYNFTRKTYNHNMLEAAEYAVKLLGNDPKQRYGEYLEKIKKILQQLNNLGVKSYSELIHLVKTREDVEAFCSRANLGLSELVRVLKYLLYWVLPSKMYLRELIDKKKAGESPT